MILQSGDRRALEAMASSAEGALADPAVSADDRFYAVRALLDLGDGERSVATLTRYLAPALIADDVKRAQWVIERLAWAVGFP